MRTKDTVRDEGFGKHKKEKKEMKNTTITIAELKKMKDIGTFLDVVPDHLTVVYEESKDGREARILPTQESMPYWPTGDLKIVDLRLPSQKYAEDRKEIKE